MNNNAPVGAAILPVTPFSQNCTMLWCTQTMKGVFVDAGGEADKLLAAADEHGVTIEAVWLTHGHLDHAGGAADVRDRLDVPIIGPHEDDLFWLEGIEQQAQMYGIGGLRTCVPDRWLQEGDTLTVGNLRFEVVHCPGHTPGHLVFYNTALELAFVGDVLFAGSIGRTDFPKGNFDDLVASITGKLWPLGNDIAFVPGHGPMSTFGQERLTNPFVGDAALSR